MADDLTKIDRWNSEPLDVHTWSDHPEIKTLCDDLYDLAGMTTLEPKDLSPDELALVDTIRNQLQAYNSLLKHTLIDIPSYTSSTFTRTIKNGRYSGRKQTISLGPDNKFVIRVFNGGLAGKWQRGGRFYRGWWQQIDKEDRCKIYINDQPTLEVDFKAFHPNLLSNELGVKLSGDPYDLGKLILPEVITTKEEQREYVKLLVLMGINADSDKKAYQAFRNSDRKDKLGQSLTDIHLATLLDGFINKHPQFKGVLNTGQALRLMNIDSQIANLVIDHFTQKDIPVLCIHDSFIIQYDKEPELRSILESDSKLIERSPFLARCRVTRLMCAMRIQASALAIDFSQSFDRRLQRFSQAKVRSTTQRRGRTSKPAVVSERLTI